MPSLNWLTYYLGMVVNGHAVLPTLAKAKFLKKWFAKCFHFCAMKCIVGNTGNELHD